MLVKTKMKLIYKITKSFLQNLLVINNQSTTVNLKNKYFKFGC